MRFEKQNQEQRIKTLYRLHRYINKHLYDNQLHSIRISSESYEEGEIPEYLWGIDANGEFIIGNTLDKSGQPYYGVFNAHQGITILCATIMEVAKMKTQAEQVLFLGMIMLHEMNHQYCYEKGIDDLSHGERWCKIAEDHGLHCEYENNRQMDEYLNTLGVYVLRGFQMNVR